MQSKPVPTIVDLPYGPHFRNVFDFWRVESDTPAPVFVWIHGGGFIGGDKSDVSPQLLEQALAQGIAVASVNYRFSQQAPFPASFHDAGRALQMLRYFCAPWNIDPTRIMVGGCSAGGGIALWLGYHADLADPASDDPLARESSRPNAMAVIDTQSTYNPTEIRAMIPGTAYLHPAMQMLFRVRVEEFDTPEAQARCADGSPLTHATAAAPPTFLFYSRRPPLTDDLSQEAGIHHARFGEVLRDRLDMLGVPCRMRCHGEHPEDAAETATTVYVRETLAFLRQHLPS